MTIRNLTREEILGQIKYLEQNISNGSVFYLTNRLNRIRTLKASLRMASWLTFIKPYRAESRKTCKYADAGGKLINTDSEAKWLMIAEALFFLEHYIL